LISSTYLREAFAAVAPQSVRNKSSCQYLFTLLGSTSVKALRGTVMKLSPSHLCRFFFEARKVISSEILFICYFKLKNYSLQKVLYKFFLKMESLLLLNAYLNFPPTFYPQNI